MTGETSASADEVQSSHSHGASTASKVMFSKTRLLHHQLASVLDSLSDLQQ